MGDTLSKTQFRKKFWGAPDTHRPKFVRKRFSKFSIFGLFSAKITTFWVLYPYRGRKWCEHHEKIFLSFLDPIWCGPKNFRPPHPKKVCFRGCRIVHKNHVFVDFSTKLNVLGILVCIYDVEVGQSLPKMISELSGPQVVLSETFLIIPPQKSGLEECRIFCKSRLFSLLGG